MLPYIEILSRPVPMYGLLAGVGVLLAVLYMKQAEKRYPELVADAELGADLPYLWTKTSAFLEKYLYAGFVFFGGLYGAVAAVWLYARGARVPAEKLLNILLPAVPLIHSLGRAGCFCVGCCYGKPSEKWGVVFSRSEIAPAGVPLLPVQLYEAAGAMLLFIALACMGAKRADGRKMLAVYLLAYGLLRFGLEFLRGDAYRGFVLGLSVSQVIALLSMALAAVLLIRLRKREGEAADAPSSQ